MKTRWQEGGCYCAICGACVCLCVYVCAVRAEKKEWKPIKKNISISTIMLQPQCASHMGPANGNNHATAICMAIDKLNGEGHVPRTGALIPSNTQFLFFFLLRSFFSTRDFFFLSVSFSACVRCASVCVCDMRAVRPYSQNRSAASPLLPCHYPFMSECV